MTIQSILDDVLAREGGYVDVPQDRGGCTNMGITRQTLHDWRGVPVTCEDVKNLTRTEALEIYRELYVTRPGFELIRDVRLRALLIDFGVHSGPRTAIRALQRVIGAEADGRIGRETLAKIQTVSAPEIYRIVLQSRVLYLADLLRRDPTQRVFAAGWFRRMADFL